MRTRRGGKGLGAGDRPRALTDGRVGVAGVPRGACVAAPRAAIGRAGLGGRGVSLCGRGARRQRRRASGGGRAASGGPCPRRAGGSVRSSLAEPPSEENVQVTLLGVSLRLPGLEEGGQAGCFGTQKLMYGAVAGCTGWVTANLVGIPGSSRLRTVAFLA